MCLLSYDLCSVVYALIIHFFVAGHECILDVLFVYPGWFPQYSLHWVACIHWRRSCKEAGSHNKFSNFQSSLTDYFGEEAICYSRLK